MTIYIDIIFLENLVLNYIILFATAIVLKIKVKQYRVFISSLIGAMYAVVYYIIDLKWFIFAGMKIMLSIVIIYIAFNANNFRNLVKQIILFYVVSFIFAGASLAVIYMVNTHNITIQNGTIVGKYTLKTVLIGILLSFIVIIVSLRIIKKRRSIFCDVKIYLNNKMIETKAMIDTGNFLREPITNIPVVVVENTILYDIIPKQILNNIENILCGDFNKIPKEIEEEYISRLKIIPFSSLGKQNGMLLGIRAKKIEIIYEEDIKIIDKVILGIYDKSLTKRGEYRALVGLDLI